MRLTIIIIFALVVFSLSISHADTINIPADYPLIQQGIEAAVNGDVVLVAPGTYLENLNFLGKAITVKGRTGAWSTIIDGSAPTDSRSGSVVTFNSGEGTDSVLDGFLLKGGEGTSPYKSGGPYVGGGIYCTNKSSPKIRKTVIYKNTATDGAGMYCDSGSPQLIQCEIDRNECDRNGGGLYLVNCDAVLKDCTIEDNSIVGINGFGAGLCNYVSRTLMIDCEVHMNDHRGGSGQGGGIYNYAGDLELIRCTIDYSYVWLDVDGAGLANDSGTVELTDCIFKSNTFVWYSSSTNGGGIYCMKGSMYLKRCIFTNNQANLYGGGIYSVSSNMELDTCFFLYNKGIGGGISCSGGQLSLTCCTFTDNKGLTGGGGLYLDEGAIVNVTNSILWENDSSDGSEIWLANSTDPATLTIDHSDVEGGQSSIHIEPGCTLNWGPSMIDADPLFADPSRQDYHLTYHSPCRDSGDDTVPGLSSLDIEGDARIYESTVDMGADEFHPHLYVLRDNYPSIDIQGKLIGLPGTTPVGVFLGSGIRETPVQTPYGDFFLLPPRMLVPLVPIPSGGILVIQIWPPGRYDLPMQGLVGLNSDSLTNLCVLEVR